MAARWLLDTCVVSELTHPEPDACVTDWLSQHAHESAVAAVSVGEVQFGLQRLPAGARKRRPHMWFEVLCTDFSDRLLPSSVEVWREFGRLKAASDPGGSKS